MSRKLKAMAVSTAAIFLMSMQNGLVQDAKVPDISALAGRQIYALKKCGECHDQGAKKYTPIKAAWDSTKLAAHVEALKLENVLRQDTSERRKKRTFGDEIIAMVAYLENRQQADAAAKNFVTAGFAMTREGCRTCHMINGVGKETGPNLKNLGKQHDKKWLIDHFINPQAFVKDSVMPQFGHLPKEELEAMADYLLMLK
ncbi:MAG: cbb3-type cytochrome c oxidase subunit II [candidate division KSB1 bacterium]|nr:cbb3-type cytochrome c oxidase subunit II [candidate division KSB1 bacterium]